LGLRTRWESWSGHFLRRGDASIGQGPGIRDTECRASPPSSSSTPSYFRRAVRFAGKSWTPRGCRWGRMWPSSPGRPLPIRLGARRSPERCAGDPSTSLSLTDDAGQFALEGLELAAKYHLVAGGRGMSTRELEGAIASPDAFCVLRVHWIYGTRVVAEDQSGQAVRAFASNAPPLAMACQDRGSRRSACGLACALLRSAGYRGPVVGAGEPPVPVLRVDSGRMGWPQSRFTPRAGPSAGGGRVRVHPRSRRE
jgi:hypothetical protein